MRDLAESEAEQVARATIRATEMGTLLTVEEAAGVLRLSVGSVYQLCATRKLRHQRVGKGRGKILIPLDAIDEYLSHGTVSVEEAARPAPRPRRVYKHINL